MTTASKKRCGERRRDRLEAAGLCLTDHRRPAVPGRQLCADCLERDRARKRCGPRRVCACGLCGELGHYRQTCPRRRNEQAGRQLGGVT